MRNRLQRLLDARPSPTPGAQQDPQQEMVDRIFAIQQRRTLELLAQYEAGSAPQLAVALSHLMLSGSEEAMGIGAEWQNTELPQVACQSGCAHCCHQPLQVTILDCIGVAAARRRPLNYTLPSRQRNALKRDFRACPLLLENRCSVYNSRPVVCRAFHSTQLSRCQEIVRIQDPNRQTPMLVQLFGLTGLPQAAMQKVFEEVGIEHRPVVLGLAVSALCEDFEGLTSDWLSGGRRLLEIAGVEE